MRLPTARPLRPSRSLSLSLSLFLSLSLYLSLLPPTPCKTHRRSTLERRGNRLKGFRTFKRKPGPEPGPDCLACAEFARQRHVVAMLEDLNSRAVSYEQGTRV